VQTRTRPVDIVEFIESPAYLNKHGEIYPRVMDALVELNSGRYQEAVLTGSIGVGKTSIAILSSAFSLFCLSLMRNPQREFGLDPSSEIVIIFQSINERLARSVDYARFKALIDASPYFRQHFPYDRRVESELRFPNRVIVKAVTGDIAGAIGQNVIGGVLDETQAMARVDRSKRAVDGGEYDQATALYNSIVRRRKSRFMRGGRLPGILCLVGSKRYPGQFSDQRIAAAGADPTIFVYDKRTWEVLPEDRFRGEWFNVFVGDSGRRPRILNPDEDVPPDDQDLVLPVPVEYRDDFERDINDALREIGGVSTLAVHPFFANRERLRAAFGTCDSILSLTTVDFSQDEGKLRYLRRRLQNPKQPRFAHIDLALTGDSVGLCIGHVARYVDVGDDEYTQGKMPHIVIDATLRITPPRNGEIDFARVRKVLFRLQEEGVDLRMVSLDGYQSRDTIQILCGRQITAGLQSMDMTPEPYSYLKTAFYDGRLEIPTDAHLLGELLTLEYDAERGKVDHPSHRGSKDVADALCGVVYGLTRMRLFWAAHGVNPVQAPALLWAGPSRESN
jgi:hypothetical protein